MRQHPRLAILVCLLVLFAAGGGVARWDAYSLLYVRPAAVIALGLLFIVPGAWNWQGLRTPLLLLLAFTATIAVQLIPLPPALWSQLGAREPYLQAAVIAGVPQPWRPISLLPFRTANSLLATVPAFAALIALAGIPRHKWRTIVHLLLAICCVSALLGTIQYASSLFYPYDPSDKGLPIGLLANRNHQALLLTIGLLLLAQWGLDDYGHTGGMTKPAVALAGIVFLCLIILLTGSRTGLVIMVLALAVIAVAAGLLITRVKGRRRPWLPWLIALAPFLVVAVGAYAAQSSGFSRLDQSLGEDMRTKALPTVWLIAQHYLPWGAGFGTFDRVFMQFEPEQLLVRGFYNRAHSDPLEVLIAGGLPSILVVAAFLVWLLGITGIDLLRKARVGSGRYIVFTAIMLALIASITDYPLRPPLMTLIFTLLCGLYAGSLAVDAADSPFPPMPRRRSR